MARRLPERPGEWLERDHPREFRFEGHPCVGLEGDTVTSALLANGVTTLGRSFKYHRRRGVLSAADRDINALVTDGVDPHLRADVTPLREGMDLRAVNTRGGLAADRAALLDRLGRLLPVGFYYKAFHTPRSLFPFWERLIRHLAGLGEVDPASAPARWPRSTEHCDLLVVGAGATGLAAAAGAAEGGARTVLVDENRYPGASLVDAALADPAAGERRQRLLERAEAAGVEIRTATFAAGYYADGWVPLVGTAGLTRMRAGAVIVATGAFEQPWVFRNNDLPGVMLASAATTLAARYSVAAAERPVVLAG
ncbi:MAG: 2Fe-2S iron-sulfur cluster-binding protein, partial [Thiohalospira sp.]